MILEVMEMYCRNCGQYVSEDMLYCPRCGYQLAEAKKICYYCKNPLKENEDVCPCCGKSQVKSKPKDPYRGYWKKPVIWIILVVLLAGSVYLSDYMTSHPLNLGATVSENETITMTGEMNQSMLAANNQCEGFAFLDGQAFYYVKDHNLYQMTLDDKQEQKKLIEGCQGYICVVENKLYYCDSYYDYYCYDLESGTQEKLLENIYYPVVYENKLYYQLDKDGESIHCLDMESGQDQKLNDEVSYSLSVDTAHLQLYYLAYDEEKYTIKSMSLTGENQQEVYQCQGNSSFVMDDDYIYVYDEDKIIKINKEDKKQETLKENLLMGYINICQDQIIYTSGNLYKMSKDGKDNQALNDGYVYQMQVTGNQIIIVSYINNENVYQIVDLDGQVTNLLQQQQVQQFEDLEEV